MYMSEYEKEINEAMAYLSINDEVTVFSGRQKENLLSHLQSQFVIENPRVWWLSLKYQATAYDFDGDYKQITQFFDKNEKVWFIVEDDECLLYQIKVSNIIDIIGECSCFEYYLISENEKRFLCETDHGVFLYVDREKNKNNFDK